MLLCFCGRKQAVKVSGEETSLKHTSDGHKGARASAMAYSGAHVRAWHREQESDATASEKAI